MRVLLLDIENSPYTSHHWGMWEQNISLPALLQPMDVMCFAAKWLGDPQSKTIFRAGRFHPDGIQAEMVTAAHALLDEADAVMHYNGKRHDIPHLNREFMELGLKPPSPYKQIDLMTTAKNVLKLPSFKLAYVAEWLGHGGKLKHEGLELWLRCMRGDPVAWRKMERYNKRDVRLLELVYGDFKPWIRVHPNAGLYSDDPMRPQCRVCQSEKLQRRGYATTSLGKYARFQCQACGAWQQGAKRISGVETREVQ